MAQLLLQTYKGIKKLVIIVIGSSIILFGVLLLFTPGPGTLVIIVGLTVLGAELAWARVLLHRFKGYSNKLSKPILNIFFPANTIKTENAPAKVPKITKGADHA